MGANEPGTVPEVPPELLRGRGHGTASGWVVASNLFPGWAHRRAHTYKLLSHGLDRPTEFNRASLRKNIEQSAGMFEGVGAVLLYRLLPVVWSKRKWRALNKEYARLFEPPNRRARCPPVASAYREVDMAALVAEYRREPVFHAYSHPPDHVVVECDFLFHLCHQELECWFGEEHGLLLHPMERERGFLANHLSWTPEFARRVEEEAGPFYRSLAALLRLSVAGDLRDLEWAQRRMVTEEAAL